MRRNLIVSGVAVILLLDSCAAHAQLTIDASKITCDQFVHSKVGPTRTVAAWLSGFYNGRRNIRVIDIETFEANLGKLESFCYDEKNFKVTVMQAIEKVIGKAK